MNKYDAFFDEICERYYKDIFKYLVFTLKNEEAANDITQDTFVVVYKNIKKVYNHENIGGYIFRTAQNLGKNYKKELYKRLIREINIDDNVVDIQDYKSDIESRMDADIDEYEYIIDIIDSLSDEKKRLYNMYYVEHKPMKEIAAVMNVEYTAIRMKYVRLRKEIREMVRELAEKYFVT